MDVYVAQHQVTVKDAPLGLLVVESGELILKTAEKNKDKCLCYVVESGDMFIGGNATICRPVIVI